MTDRIWRVEQMPFSLPRVLSCCNLVLIIIYMIYTRLSTHVHLSKHVRSWLTSSTSSFDQDDGLVHLTVNIYFILNNPFHPHLKFITTATWVPGTLDIRHKLGVGIRGMLPFVLIPIKYIIILRGTQNNPDSFEKLILLVFRSESLMCRMGI